MLTFKANELSGLITFTICPGERWAFTRIDTHTFESDVARFSTRPSGIDDFSRAFCAE